MAWSAWGSMRRIIAWAVAAGANQFPFVTGAPRVLGVGVLAILIAAHAALAAPAALNEPVFDPASGSYFIVRDMSGEWESADYFARSLKFEGRRGRLAVIRSKQTQEFLKTNLHLDAPTWFGLRYECGSRALVWVDGHVISGHDFTYWHPKWNRDPKVHCSNDPNDLGYMPVYLMSSEQGTPFLWQATGMGKIFERVLVEFPRLPAAK